MGRPNGLDADARDRCLGREGRKHGQDAAGYFPPSFECERCKGGKDLRVFPVCSGELHPDPRVNYSQPVEGVHIIELIELIDDMNSGQRY